MAGHTMWDKAEILGKSAVMDGTKRTAGRGGFALMAVLGLCCIAQIAQAGPVVKDIEFSSRPG
ncbi:MAG: hypothetical protein ACK5HY_02840, partial [Parahaliea sp.]